MINMEQKLLLLLFIYFSLTLCSHLNQKLILFHDYYATNNYKNNHFACFVQFVQFVYMTCVCVCVFFIAS
jgi:hypothetical protein